MRITAIETIRIDHLPNVCLVHVHTDEGLIGLGETFYGADAVETYIHSEAAGRLLDDDPLAIQRHATTLHGYLGHTGSGPGRRGNSAIDIALWDLLGKATGEPLHQLLGGRSREAIETYNTCAGPGYVRRSIGQWSANWGLGGPGAYEDLDAFLNRPVELAEELLESGFTGMKIWPFDMLAEDRQGAYLTRADLAAGLEPIRLIRESLGDRLEILVEFHGLWNMPAAEMILRELGQYGVFWAEDPIRPALPATLGALRSRTNVPIAAGETIGDRATYQGLLDANAVDVLIVDIGWCGGVTESRKIATLADTKSIPVALHDCSGPIQFTASIHLGLSLPNATLQEMTRAFYHSWYEDIVTPLPLFSGGQLRPPDGAGLGVDLQPDLLERNGVNSTRTTVGA